MPYSAFNGENVGNEWNAKNMYESEDIVKLDILVAPGTTAAPGIAVEIQWLEGDERGYATDEKQYVLLRPGFHSITFPTPMRRYRLRQWPLDPNYGKSLAICQVDIREFS